MEHSSYWSHWFRDLIFKLNSKVTTWTFYNIAYCLVGYYYRLQIHDNPHDPLGWDAAYATGFVSSKFEPWYYPKELFRIANFGNRIFPDDIPYANLCDYVWCADGGLTYDRTKSHN